MRPTLAAHGRSENFLLAAVGAPLPAVIDKALRSEFAQALERSTEFSSA